MQKNKSKQNSQASRAITKETRSEKNVNSNYGISDIEKITSVGGLVLNGK